MDKRLLEKYWRDLPTNKEDACTYPVLCAYWCASERAVRHILHELSHYDNGDDYILIRSASVKGFYKTDNKEEIEAYKRECLSKGRSIFAPVKKINRVLNANTSQYTFDNNLRVIREGCGMKQSEVCKRMKKHSKAFDKSLLSKMENGVCMPTPYQCILLAEIYGVEPSALFGTDLYY